MTPRRPLNVIAASAEALVADGDLTDLLATLIDDAAEAMGAQAIGTLVQVEGGGLDVLAATSHRANELELYQAQHGSGPCITAITTASTVAVTDPAEIEARWPEVAPLVREAGYTAVHAFPLRWHDRVLGALNVFHTDASALDEDLAALGQIYADLLSSLLLRPVRLTRDVLDERVGEALNGRILIEQAKGAVAYAEGVDLDVAYDRLRQRAAREGRPLTSLAQQVLKDRGHG